MEPILTTLDYQREWWGNFNKSLFDKYTEKALNRPKKYDREKIKNQFKNGKRII
jgi:hypothetical protein